MLGLETTALVPDAADESAPMTAGEFAELDLSVVEEVRAPARDSSRELALSGDLPIIDGTAGLGEAADDDATTDIPLLDLTEGPAEPEATPTLDIELPMLDVGATAPAAETAPAAADALGFINLDAAPVEAAAAPEVDAPTDFGDVDVDIVEAPPPPVRRTTSMAIPMLAASIEDLRDQVAREPENWILRRQLAETMLDEGHRDEGLAMLEETMSGFERAGQIHDARSVADEIVRLNPLSVRHHQKRVEFAFRDDDKAGLAQAYLDLADALFRDGHPDKSKTVYQRVLEISPTDARALAAIASLSALEAPAPAAEGRPSAAGPPAVGKRKTGMISANPEPP
ncbi:MAG: tetratricopeptide repeat protein, partial [Gemmatimonadaceae bacterium]|nr:tetratricopeptide repeat protein [Gemmatimonadaceae bacterium]